MNNLNVNSTVFSPAVGANLRIETVYKPKI
jgi:hypothetical protein